MERLHHPVFDHFVRRERDVPTELQANWLGVVTSSAVANWMGGPPGDPYALPDIDSEEYPEWIDLLEAVNAAGDTFTMVELGAGWGRWLVNGYAAYRQLNPVGDVHLVGVEAEPTHFRWLAEHVRINGIGPEQAELIEAAVSGSAGRVTFEVGEPLTWWGQSVRGRATWRTRFQRRSDQQVVRAVTLADAFGSADGLIDLVDLDVQGAEADVLTAGADNLDRVRRVHIGTHGAEQERRLRSLFTNLGWVSQTDYAAGSVEPKTWWGGENVSFQDGVQSWLNPGV